MPHTLKDELDTLGTQDLLLLFQQSDGHHEDAADERNDIADHHRRKHNTRPTFLDRSLIQ